MQKQEGITGIGYKKTNSDTTHKENLEQKRTQKLTGFKKLPEEGQTSSGSILSTTTVSGSNSFTAAIYQTYLKLINGELQNEQIL